MTNYLDILLEEQIWEDEEERTSLQLPPEWARCGKKKGGAGQRAGKKSS